ncbi:hypothetical protein [Mucilaginibacter antarcticus]|uniref:Uncharacterized protein n=1 Tax=Mucilaginibacter antarcticus TaxID=1855725 RepID=A0ABW5XKZ8_9SPHI
MLQYVYEAKLIKPMDHFREIKNQLIWHNEGKFEVELINGIITKLNFCEPGQGPDDVGKCLTSTNYKYLQAVHASLGELFGFIEEENKRLGYKYAEHVPVQTYQHADTENDNAQEIKLRPLMNYDPHVENEVGNNLGNNIELTA